MAASLFLPGHEDLRASALSTTALAARELFRRIDGMGLEVHQVEQPVEAKLFKNDLRGTPDLVLGARRVVIDLKWSGDTHRAQTLESGTALQLAAYSYLVRENATDAFPPTAYFIMRSRRLMTTEPHRLGDGERIEGPPVEETWLRVHNATRARFLELYRGHARAPGALVKDRDLPVGSTMDNALTLGPPCRFCDHRVLCGRAVQERA